ncbi:MAG: DUF2868 domain-containing protein [Candidatus Electrothrix aestuarii]|uniref:DUF2868 domain-containing protein n=1 Tax=Candidatus Electrothrix aestuarii TaxID=3062594 RepID=A0AAU8LQU3_9BACT|nr:DUF2868 domain-containing protein [Candidatus Electrothrix aestuarii]
MNKTHWTIQDLIDLEFFLTHAPEKVPYVLKLWNHETTSERPDSKLLQGWLSYRKVVWLKKTGKTAPFGRLWQKHFDDSAKAALLAGLLAGEALTFFLFSSPEHKPINAASYFAVFILVQAVFLLLSAATQFFSNLLFPLFYQRLQNAASAELKQPIHISSTTQLRQRYGRIFARPFFQLTQLFWIGINAGGIAVTLFRIFSDDISLGWQIGNMHADTLHRLVSWISLPWFWLPSTSVPSLIQVEQTQLATDMGVSYYIHSSNYLQASVLVPWGSFLCLSIAFYGVLPWLLLLLAGMIRQSYDLARLDFQQDHFQPLLQHLRNLLTAKEVQPAQGPQRKKISQDIWLNFQQDYLHPFLHHLFYILAPNKNPPDENSPQGKILLEHRKSIRQHSLVVHCWIFPIILIMSLVLYKIFFKSSHASFLPWLLYIGIIGFVLVLLIPPARKNIVEIYKNTQFTFLVTDKIISCSGGGTALPIPAYCIAIDSIDRIIKKTEYKEKDGQKNIRVHYRIVNIRGQRYDIPSSFDNPREKIVQCITEHWPHIIVHEQTDKTFEIRNAPSSEDSWQTKILPEQKAQIHSQNLTSPAHSAEDDQTKILLEHKQSIRASSLISMCWLSPFILMTILMIYKTFFNVLRASSFPWVSVSVIGFVLVLLIYVAFANIIDIVKS